MNGRLEYLDWSIKPEQMQIITPFFGMVFLFLFDSTFYPLLKKLGVRKPLQKITLSSCLAFIGFIFAALLQFEINVRHLCTFYLHVFTFFVVDKQQVLICVVIGRRSGNTIQRGSSEYLQWVRL